MVAAIIVTVVIVVMAGWVFLRTPHARRELQETSASISTAASAPAPTPKTSLSGSERAILLAPLPPAFDREVAVKSRSKRGTTYQVNLGRLSCTCPDFEKRRASLPTNDIRRVCKHLGRTLEEADALSEYDQVAQALIRRNASRDGASYHGVNAERFVILPDGAHELVMAFSSGNTWVDVVTRRGTNDLVKKYKRYSYNIGERRWSYGSKPFADGEIRQAIHMNVRG